MTSKTCLVFFFSSLILTNFALAQDRAPHGLAYETPVAFSPSAFDFFHTQPENPDPTFNPCSESGCSPLPVAAKVQGASAKAQESDIVSISTGTRSGIEEHGVVGIIFGLAFAVMMWTIIDHFSKTLSLNVCIFLHFFLEAEYSSDQVFIAKAVFEGLSLSPKLYKTFGDPI